MARKKKKGRKKSSGRRRVGALSLKGDQKDTIMLTAGVIAGVIGGRVIETYAKQQFSTASTKTIGGGVLAGGIVAAMYVKDPILKGLAIGVAASGGATLAKEMGLVNGIGAPIVFAQSNGQFRRVAGSGSNMPKIGQPNYNVPRVGANMYNSRRYAVAGAM